MIKHLTLLIASSKCMKYLSIFLVKELTQRIAKINSKQLCNVLVKMVAVKMTLMLMLTASDLKLYHKISS